MPKSVTRPYSRYSRDAVSLLGALIGEARKERKITAQALADRAGIRLSNELTFNDFINTL